MLTIIDRFHSLNKMHVSLNGVKDLDSEMLSFILETVSEYIIETF